MTAIKNLLKSGDKMSYLTASEVKSLSSLSEVLELTDAKLTSFISRAETMINRKCRQDFNDEGLATKLYDGHDSDIIKLKGRLYSLTSVEIDDIDYTSDVILRYSNQSSYIIYKLESTESRFYVAKYQIAGRFFPLGTENVAI